MKLKYLKFLLPIILLLGIAAALVVRQLLTGTQQEEAIHIAFAGPLTGDDAEYGEAYLRGINLYLDRINQQGGLYGKKLVLDRHDDRNEKNPARQRALKIVEQNQAVAVIGHDCRECSLNAGKVYKQFKVPAITPASGDSDVIKDNEWYFSAMPTHVSQTRFLAHYIALILRYRSVSIIQEDQDYGTTVTRAFEQAAGDLDITIRRKWLFRVKDTALDRSLEQIVEQLRQFGERAGLVFVIAQPAEGAKLLKLCKEAGIHNAFILPSSLASREFQNLFADDPQEMVTPGYYTEGMYVAAPILFDSAGAQAQEFRTAYRQIYANDPDWRAAFGYDAAMLIGEAIRYTGAQGIADTLQDDRQKIRTYLAGLQTPEKSVEGVTGANYFTDEGTPQKPLSIGVYKHGAITPAFVQLSVIPDSLNPADTDQGIQDVLVMDGQYLHKTNVVYAGAIVNEVEALDIENLTVTLDYDLWFRYQGTLDVENVGFLNAAEPLELGEPAVQEIGERVSYQRYRLQGSFKLDFQSTDRLLGNHLLGISLRHRNSPIQELVYVTDVVGMGFRDDAPFVQTMKQEVLRGVGAGWLVDRINLFQGIVEQHSKGDPRYVDLTRKTVSYSQFNLEIWIQKDTFSLRKIVPYEYAPYLIALGFGTLLTLFIAHRVQRAIFRKIHALKTSESPQPAAAEQGKQLGVRKQRKQRYVPLSFLQISWGIQTACVILLLLAIEAFMLGWFTDTLTAFFLERIILVFDLLWWLGPAFLLVLATEHFMWSPLEIKTGRAVPILVHRMVAFVVYLLALFGIIAFVFQRPLTGFLASTGVFAMIVGLAVQINISNIFSGISINIEQPFRLGDWVKIGDHGEGRVVDITWRSTRIQTRKSYNIVSIPNSVASESVIVNYNYPDDRFGLYFKLETADHYQPAQVRKVLLDAVLAVKDVCRAPAPEIEFHGQGDSSAIFAVEFHVKDYKKRDEHMTAVWESVWNHLVQADIALATPCRFIYEYEGSELADQRTFTPLAVLQNFELFQAFPDEVKAALSERLRTYRVSPNTRIMKEGDSGDSMFIIAGGVVGIWITLDDGSSIEVARRGPGDIIGEMALLTGEARTASVISISTALLYEMTKDDVAPYLQEQPEIAERLSEILTRRKLETSQAKDAHSTQEEEAKSLSRQFLTKIQTFFGLSAREEEELSPVAVIQQMDMFQSFSEVTKIELSERMKQRRANVGMTVVKQGDKGDSLFFIATGRVAVWVTLDDGKRLRVDQMEAGTFFGETALLTGDPRSASIVTETECILYEITKDDIAPVLKSYPKLARQLSKELTRRAIQRETQKGRKQAKQINARTLSQEYLQKIERFFKLHG